MAVGGVVRSPPMSRSLRIGLVVLAIVILGLGAWATRIPPRVTLLNSSLSIANHWRATLGWAGITAVPVLLALASSRRAVRVLLGLVAALLALQAWHVAAFRLLAGEATLQERQALATLEIGWKEVTRVESAPKEVAVWGPSSQILIDTSRFSADQRATLDRTIARRLREH